jgi:hypothetical protein
MLLAVRSGGSGRPAMPDFNRIKELLAARHACVRIVTNDEDEAREAVLNAAPGFQLPAYVWTTLDGVRPADLPVTESVPNTTPPEAGLYHMLRFVEGPFMLVTLDLAEHMGAPGDAKVVRALRELIERCRSDGGVVVMIDHRDHVPPVIAAQGTLVRPSRPSDAEMESVVRAAVRAANKDRPVQAKVSKEFLDILVRNLRGLSRRQARQAVMELVTDDGKLDESDLPRLMKAKRALVQTDGLLEYVDAPQNLDEVAGLRRLKAWLRDRQHAFSDGAEAFGLTTPRGVLLLGVQGAGKSLSAKAIATAWQRPLMRLDPGVLYDRYIGESEQRLRESLHQAEAMAPIILWIDEIEKGFAGAASQSTDGGLSQRMFGTLLTWMQEHRSAVFLVATANNIEALPPELLRKGRFDEIFFVDLPTPEVRREIFRVHLKKRKRDPQQFDLDALAAASEGYSGAEIEQAILAALHTAYSQKRELPTALILDALRNSPPLSVTMAEDMEELRAWAKGRCVPAD